MKNLLIGFAILVSPPTFSQSQFSAQDKYLPNGWDKVELEDGNPLVSHFELAYKAEELYDYAKSIGFNTEVAVLVDMGMKSNYKRLFVVNLIDKRILASGLVTHGHGDREMNLRNKRYSNNPGSKLTALGKYKIGEPYNGEFGKAYKMYGLEQSNSHAYKRAIVLHAMPMVPDFEVDFPIIQSEGCPAVAPSFLGLLARILDDSKKPVIMWIYK